MLNNSKHYDLFLNPIHYYQTYIVCCMSITINSALIYVILCKPHQKIGNYKYILLSFAAFDISYSIVDAMTKPTVREDGSYDINWRDSLGFSNLVLIETLIEKLGKLFGVKITNNVSDSHVATSGRVLPNPNQECAGNG
ncbi:hypothetical protein WR25_08006 [Diploscapter pachys]|uniref:Uncharacterized protein n=1 Tax=Diploscapter pachys TaxID=2018661 RepID=A0A2A2JPX2_9BILA|nr:hypothetical protein WR25_08006 [Diploscapter pachys]